MTFDIVSSFHAARGHRAATNAITLRLVTDSHRWNRLVARAPHPHLPQSYAYGAGKVASGWHAERVEFMRNGRAVAFATVLQLKRFGITLLNRVNRGPVFIVSEPSDELTVDVYRALRGRYGHFWQGPLLIAPALPRSKPAADLLSQAGYRVRSQQSWISARIDLTRSEDEIWRGFASTFRNRVRNAEKSGGTLEVTSDDAAHEWMLARHTENMAEKGFTALAPNMLRALRGAAPESVLVFRMLHEGTPVAGMSIVSFGTHCEYHIGWFGPEGRKLNAGNFLMWGVMREMKRRGLRTFDVGGLKPGDGYTRFKRTMNPAEYELCGEWMSF